MKCIKCSEENEYAQANQPNGDFLCYQCRPKSIVSKDKIPTTLEECFEVLLVLSKKKEIDMIRSQPEKDMCHHHHGIGMWMRNTWGLWQGGPLQDHFKKMGLWHADDMSGVILTSFHRHLNNKPLEVEEQIKHYLDYWKKQNISG